MKRRELMLLLGGAMTAAGAVRAQQKAMPVIGYLSQRSPTDSASIVAAFRQGLKEEGYVEGQNVVIESRFAEGQIDRLPGLASDLVRHGVNVFVATGGTGSVVNARPVVPETIPMVFAMGAIRSNSALSRASRDRATTSRECLSAQRAGAQAGRVAAPDCTQGGRHRLPRRPEGPGYRVGHQKCASGSKFPGHELVVVKASNASEIAPAFDALAQQNIKAVFINADPLFNVNFSQIRELAARYAMATISSWEGFAAEGGLISYGTSIDEANRLLGVYTGRVLKGEKPADLPVQQSTKFRLVVNLKTARALGLTIQPSILGLADDVIE